MLFSAPPLQLQRLRRERSEASLFDWRQTLAVVEILHSLRSFRMTRVGKLKVDKTLAHVSRGS